MDFKIQEAQLERFLEELVATKHALEQKQEDARMAAEVGKLLLEENKRLENELKSCRQLLWNYDHLSQRLQENQESSNTFADSDIRLDDLMEQNNRVNLVNKKLMRQVSDSEKTRFQILEQLEETKKNLEKWKQEFIRETEKNKNMLEEIENMKEENLAKDQEISRLHSQVKHYLSRKDFQEQNQELLFLLNKERKKSGDAENRSLKYQEEMDRLEVANKNLHLQVSSMLEENENLEAANRKAETEKDILRNEIRELKMLLSEITKKLDEANEKLQENALQSFRGESLVFSVPTLVISSSTTAVQTDFDLSTPKVNASRSIEYDFPSTIEGNALPLNAPELSKPHLLVTDLDSTIPTQTFVDALQTPPPRSSSVKSQLVPPSPGTGKHITSLLRSVLTTKTSGIRGNSNNSWELSRNRRNSTDQSEALD